MIPINRTRAAARAANYQRERIELRALNVQRLMRTRGRAATMTGSTSGVAVPKDEPTRPGKGAPNIAERTWMGALAAHGCIACRLDGNDPRPTAVHHMLRGGQRIGHLFTLPLCDPGHHQNGAPIGLISRHPYKAQFEARYGTEAELLAIVQANIGVKQ